MTTENKIPASIWFSPPAWDINPDTVEALIESVKALKAAERLTGDKAPYSHLQLVSADLFLDVCSRLLELEKAVPKWHSI